MSVIFDDKDLTELFNDEQGLAVPVDVVRNIASNFNNNYQEQGYRRYGQQFLYNTLSVKQIQVSFNLVGNFDYFNSVAETLGGYLNVDEPKTLIFGDEPNKVWEAIPSGQVSLTVDKNTAPLTAKVSVTFDIPKSYSENKAEALVSSDGESKYGSIKKISTGHYKATLNNFGTAETYPNIKLKFNSDNGWVGIVKSATESYEIGNPNEADMQKVKRSEMLMDYRKAEDVRRGFDVGLKNVGRFNDDSENLNGTLGIIDVFNRPNIALTSRGSGPRQKQGSSITWEIPADSSGEKGSLNDYIWWRQVFWLGSPNQYGFIKISVTDENGAFIYGVETKKTENGIGCEYNFLVTDGNGGYVILDNKRFYGTHLDEHNPFNATRGWSDITRRDDEITFYWWGTYPKFKVQALKGRKSSRVNILLAGIRQSPLVTHMYLDEFYYWKDFVNATEDIPNSFSKGSTLEIDMSKGKTLFNNLPANNELTYLSEPFSIGTGETEIDIYTSSWITTDPTIEINWKERFV
ncbi:phage tail family protein [Streptococcus thermophilus]|uniref:distal tail protein Dit n=1 Tax=Streptococcus thermophilus TaxID=1308 RepID=UPI001A98E996|nr:distal tail protein Dit [Streptococcus thermophilus]QTA47223.1 phage tail family protein [Streptococcus thermophilus]